MYVKLPFQLPGTLCSVESKYALSVLLSQTIYSALFKERHKCHTSFRSVTRILEHILCRIEIGSNEDTLRLLNIRYAPVRA